MSTTESTSERSVETSAELLQSLADVKTQLQRTCELIESSANAQRIRRQRFTLRTLLVLITLSAVGSAWFGKVYRDARRQSEAIDQLLDYQPNFTFRPRESLIVGLLPGTPSDPPRMVRRAVGEDFLSEVCDLVVGIPADNAQAKKEILGAIGMLPTLRGLRISGPLRSRDLSFIPRMTELESLSLTRSGLDSGSLRGIERTRLLWFDGSHTCLSSAAAYSLSRCRDLQHLNLERTAVGDDALVHFESLTKLRYLNLNRTPTTRSAVVALSKKLPDCQIEWQPLKFLPNGKLDVQAAFQGELTLGKPRAFDPRQHLRARPPGAQLNLDWTSEVLYYQ